MKKVILIVLTLLMAISIVGCSATPKEEVGAIESSMASQEEFLKDMAAGINQRLANVKDAADEEAMTDDEYIRYFNDLVRYELDQIEKYESQKFENSDFDRLAHLYISACIMQETAMENFSTNAELYYALLDSAYFARYGLIVTLYERYGLPITAEQAGEYRIERDNTNYSVSVDSEPFEIFPNVENETVLSVGDLMIVDADVEKKGGHAGKEYYNYSYVIKNNSDYALIKISINYDIEDLNGNILGTEYASISANIKSGKTAAIDGSTVEEEYPTPFCIVPREFIYEWDGSSSFFDLEVDPENAEQFKLVVY